MDDGAVKCSACGSVNCVMGVPAWTDDVDVDHVAVKVTCLDCNTERTGTYALRPVGGAEAEEAPPKTIPIGTEIVSKIFFTKYEVTDIRVAEDGVVLYRIGETLTFEPDTQLRQEYHVIDKAMTNKVRGTQVVRKEEIQNLLFLIGTAPTEVSEKARAELDFILSLTPVGTVVHIIVRE